MSAIPEEVADKIFDAIDEIRQFLPEAAAVAEILDPAAAPEIAAGEAFLSKLFELVVELRSRATRDDAAAALRAQTTGAWRATLDVAQAARAAVK